ncbi:MAG TPA: DNA-3-methyladenine glycosylase [Coleofasciculaceae cyanobacterium]
MDYSMAIATLKQADPILGLTIDRVGDCLLNAEPRTGTLLDALVQSIIYQQLSGKAAAAIHRRFLQLYPDLPSLTPDAILVTPDEVMRSAGLSRSKVLYIKDLAQKIEAGLPLIAELESMDDESIIRLLTQVKGIGRWTVEMLLMFRLHRWDVLPVDDLGIRSAIRNLYNLEDLPNKKTIETIGQPWKPYRTIASWYLWRSLELK